MELRHLQELLPGVLLECFSFIHEGRYVGASRVWDELLANERGLGLRRCQGWLRSARTIPRHRVPSPRAHVLRWGRKFLLAS